MSMRWKISCPYCKAEFSYGYGYLKIPKPWVPIVRCQFCGRLMETGSKEYLNMTVVERLTLKNDAQTMNDIKSSLERTNHEEYRALLTKSGYKFYPITDVDEQHFAGIKRFSECKPTSQTTESLYDLGILIKAEIKDEKTGGIKQEVLDDQQRRYKQTRKSVFFSLLTGFVVLGIFAAIISGAASKTDLSFLALLPAIAAGAAVAVGMGKYYESKNKTEAAKQQKEKEAQQKLEQERQKQANEEERQRTIAKSDEIKKANETRKKLEAEEAKKKKAEQDAAACKKLLDECGMLFFIEYYPQLKRLPIRDVVVSDHYFPERQVRLPAAKKIIDDGLTECALHYIIDTFGDVFSAEAIDRAKTILNEIKNEKGETK